MSKPKAKLKNSQSGAPAKQKSSKLPISTPIQLASGLNGQQPLYDQIDKVEFYIPSSKIPTDKIQIATLVGIPVTDGENLRMVKVKSCRVYIWNRGAHDLYLEVLQPFGAHSNSNTIVAWGPVIGAKSRPQSRWTVKANKSGGSFRIDLTDNNFTLPATFSATPGGATEKARLCLALFAFAVLRNEGSFTGDKDAISSRALQIKIVMEYWGPDGVPQNAVLMKGTYASMGAVTPYPLADTNEVFKQMGLITLARLTGVKDFTSQDHEVTSKLPFPSGKVYVDSHNGAWSGTPDTRLFAMAVPSHLRYALDNLDAHEQQGCFPITPVQGLVWKTDDDNFQDHLLMTGIGDMLVKGSKFPPFQRPSEDHWYVGTSYTNRRGTVNYAPVLFGDTNSSHDVLNTFLRAQSAHSGRVVMLDRLIGYQPQWQVYAPNLKGVFPQATTERLLVPKRDVLGAEVGAFTVGAWIAMVTVILKVIEAAYNAYTTYQPTNVGDVYQMPNHKVLEGAGKEEEWDML